jgi:hypothetical protein
MQMIKGLKWACASMLIVTSLQADIVIDNQTIPGSDIQSITINPTSGNIFVSTVSGYDVTPTGSPPPPSSVAINSFQATLYNIQVDGYTQLSWNVSNGVSCTPTDGIGGWTNTTIDLPSGTRNIKITTAGSWTFTLTCTGSNSDTDVKRLTVTASETPPTTTNCPTPSLSGSVENWADLWGLDFPLPVYDNQFVEIPRYGYLALKFNTGSVFDDGKLTTIETTQTDGVRLGAISECPGDFNVPTDCDYIWGISGGIRWATNGRSGACQLQNNTDYYFNVTFTDGVNPGTTTCNSAPCVTAYQAVNQ